MDWQKGNWKKRTYEGRKAMEEMDRKEEPGVKLSGFQGEVVNILHSASLQTADTI